jgi:branched-chain amino acid transport system substrate-binding protein
VRNVMQVRNGNLRAWTRLLLGSVAVTFACRPSAPPAVPAPVPPPQPERVEAPPPAALKLGLILPQSATSELAEYGTLIREGIDLALQEHAARGGRRVELVLKDDAGNPAGAARAASELQAEGAVAIIGPLLSNALDAAAAGRSNQDLLILSPTAAEQTRAAHAFSLNANDTRGATALAAWAVAAGNTRVGVLYATTPDDAAEARAFVDEATRRNVRVVAQIPFDPGTTTFAGPVERLKSAGAQAVFVPAPESDIRQLAPQLPYFGLTGVQILGTEAWISDEVLRAVRPSVLEGVIAATPLVQSGADTAWPEFVRLYEQAQRRTLDNPYPALGYDAARLVLQSIEQGNTSASDLAAAVARVTNYRGATGVLTIGNGQVTRRPFLVRIRSGRPEVLPFAGD